MRDFLKFLWLPFTVLVLVLLWLWIDADTGWLGVQMTKTGVVILLIGILLAGWCVFLLGVVGRGSPHPFTMKTKCLVRIGPYRIVRNPMMWGVGAELIGIALILGSLGLWFGFVLFVAYIAWFVPTFEEPDMEKRFGDEYRTYCLEVPRWFPRIRLHTSTRRPIAVPH